MTDLAARLPTFVIIAAPKSGTSSLYLWLAAHPDVCASPVKETNYLLEAGHPLLRPDTDFHRHGLAGYAAFFARCGSERVRVEASPKYLYSAHARSVLAGLPTRPTVLALLREPARRLYSSFQYIRDTNAQLDASVSFRAYLAAATAGDGRLLERHCHTVAGRHNLAHGPAYGRYAQWLAPWIAALGRDRVWVELFEDMVADPRAFMRRLAERLGLAPDFYDGYAFAPHNATVRARLPRLHRALSRWVPGAARAGRALPPRSPLERVYRALMVSRRPAAPDPDDRTALAALAASYDDDNRALAALAGVDLSPWRGAAGDGPAA